MKLIVLALALSGCDAALRGAAPAASAAATVDCTSDADVAAYAAIADTFSSTVNDCAGLSSGCVSIFKGIDQDCVNTCIESKGFSSTCSPAFGELAACGFSNCKADCISGDPDAESCVTCNENNCDPTFHAETGFTLGCKYVDNCNGDGVAAAAGASPSGTYAGTAKVLGLSATESLTANDDSTFDLSVSGAFTFACTGEKYTIDDSGVITPTDIDTAGDCLHDALAANSLSFGAASYDESADTISLTVTALGIPVTSTLTKAAAELSFAEFKARWGKAYASAEEEAQRFDIFVMNVEQLMERKAGMTEAQRAVFGVTKFFDQTPEEFSRSHLNYKPVAAALLAPVRNATARRSGATSVNWAATGATTPVKDQGYCGSCWAFSAVEQIESAWYLAGNDLTEFSTQQVVSCDTVDAGCNGGDSPTAYEYVEGAGGLATEAAYPYTSMSGTTGSCESFTPVGGAVKGYSYMSTPCTSRKCTGDEDMLQTALESAPASICVNAETWNSYTGGVMDSATCGKNGYYNLDHCVQLVGFNTDASTPYWIVRNSWASDWGEDGYIYLTMGENTCGVADEAMSVSF